MKWIHVFSRALCKWAWVQVPAGVRIATFSGIGLCSGGALLSHHHPSPVPDPPTRPLSAPLSEPAPVPAVLGTKHPVSADPVAMIVGPMVDWFAGPPTHGPMIVSHGTPAPLLGAGLPAFVVMGGAAGLRWLRRKSR
jgi:hypothetical protein